MWLKVVMELLIVRGGGLSHVRIVRIEVSIIRRVELGPLLDPGGARRDTLLCRYRREGRHPQGPFRNETAASGRDLLRGAAAAAARPVGGRGAAPYQLP